MKLRASVRKDENGRLSSLIVHKGRQLKGVRLDFEYGNDGYVQDILFEGRKADMPNIPEIVDLVNEGFIERIGTVKKIALLEVLEVLEEITLIKTIENIQSMPNKRTVGLENGDFETGDLAPWFKRFPTGGTAEISTEKPAHGTYSVKFVLPDPLPPNAIEIDQYIGLIRSDQVDTMRLKWWGAKNTEMGIYVYYDDATWTTIKAQQGAITGKWLWFQITGSDLDSGKKISFIGVGPTTAAANAGQTFFADLADLRLKPIDADVHMVRQEDSERTLVHLLKEDLRDAVGLGVGAGQAIITVAEGSKAVIYGYVIVNNDAANVGGYVLYIHSITTPLYVGKIACERQVLKTFPNPIEGGDGEDVAITIVDSLDTDVIVFADVVAA